MKKFMYTSVIGSAMIWFGFTVNNNVNNETKAVQPVIISDSIDTVSVVSQKTTVIDSTSILAKKEDEKEVVEKSPAIQTAKVSWYGGKFHGRLTASGVRYDKNGISAAHKTLPFGTKVKITNPENEKSVVVVINDRGPYVKHREFDLSKGAFNKISNTNEGVIKIQYEIVD